MTQPSDFAIVGVDHVNLETAYPEASTAFYRDLFGLTVGWRPAFDVPGAWLYAGGQPVIHLVFRDDAPKAADRPINHFAFQTTGLASLKKRLEASGCDYRETTVIGTEIVQILIKDPNNVGVECSFVNSEV